MNCIYIISLFRYVNINYPRDYRAYVFIARKLKPLPIYLVASLKIILSFIYVLHFTPFHSHALRSFRRTVLSIVIPAGITPFIQPV